MVRNRKFTLEERITRLEGLLKNEGHSSLTSHLARAAERWFNTNVSRLSDNDLQCLMDGDDRNTFALGDCIADLEDQFPELYDYKTQMSLLKLLGDLASRV